MKPKAKKDATHVDHVKQSVLKVSPEHGDHNPESFNDSREEGLLGEKPAQNIVINPANGLG